MPEWKDPGNTPPIDEYLRRQAMSARDYADLLDHLKRDFPGEPFLLVRYGDHQPDFAFDIGDDGVLIWLKDNSGNKTTDAVNALKNFAGDTGIAKFLFGPELAAMYQNPAHDARTPDIIGITRVGVIYTGGSKIAEHGGFNPDDTHVALLVSHPDLPAQTVDTPVATTQIAPTILKVLGLAPAELEAVRLEHTKVLPGFDAD